MQTEWILTYTGTKFYPLNPHIGDISILDIAHASSNLTRFGGHCKEFYPLAQHCVLVSNRIWNVTQNIKLALAGLLHDASEAYLIDIPRPLKYMPEFDGYRLAENNLQNLIFQAFNIELVEEEFKIIKEADEYILNVEAWFLMEKHPEWKPKTYQPDFRFFSVMTPQIAKKRFLEEFNWLMESFLRKKEATF